MFKSLISTKELNEILHSQNIVIIDCRFSLADTNEGRNEYLKAHIPNAHYAHLNDDLSGEIVPGRTGRHPFPEIDVFSKKCSAWDIGQNTQVIVIRPWAWRHSSPFMVYA